MLRKNTIKTATGILLLSSSLFLCGCMSDIANDLHSKIFGPNSINSFIDLKEEELEDITELVCDPGESQYIGSSRYDKLGKLENLESLTIAGIGFEEDAQNIFAELAKLHNLRSLTIRDSHIGSVKWLKDIEGLEELHLIMDTYSGESYKIDDLEELTKIRTLRVLDLQNVFPDVDDLPDLRGADNLEELTLSSYDIRKIPYEMVNWSDLKSLSLSSIGISKIDQRIISELDELESLDISWSKIEDVGFVLDLPGLKEFKYRKHSVRDVNMDVLKDHPNYSESWITD